MDIPSVIPNAAAIDVETDGLNPWRGHRMISAAATLTNGEQYYWEGEYSGLRRILADPTIDKVFHNATFDLRMLEWAGFKVRGRVWDTMVFCHLIYGEDAELGLSLDDMSRKYLPPTMRKVTDEIERWFDENKIGKNERYEKFGLLPPELLRKRNVGDTELTLGLFKRLYTTVAHYFPFLLRQEHELIPITKAMQDRGICIDHEEVEKQKAEFDIVIDDVMDWFNSYMGWEERFNINSRDHQLEALERCGLLPELRALPQHLKTAKGQPKLDDFNLRNLHHPVAAMLLAGKAAWKFRYTFLTGIAREAVNGIVHAGWKQLGTRTGRYSCGEPNLMNIPIEGEQGRTGYTADEVEEMWNYTRYAFGAHIKRIFITRPGYVHIHSDKKKADYAMLAHYTADPTLIRIMSDPDADIHTEYCKACFGPQVTKGLRTRTKILLFGELYGASLKRSAKTMGATVAEAAKVRLKMNQIAPGLPAWKSRMEEELDARGYVTTDHGRRHYLPRKHGYMTVSRMCQGTVGDEVKSRMVAIHNWYTAEKNGSQILLMIHDDIGTEVPLETVKRGVPTINRLMHETSIPYRLPLHASLDVTYDRWSNLVEIKDVNKVPTRQECAASSAGH